MFDACLMAAWLMAQGSWLMAKDGPMAGPAEGPGATPQVQAQVPLRGYSAIELWSYNLFGYSAAITLLGNGRRREILKYKLLAAGLGKSRQVGGDRKFWSKGGDGAS